MKHNGTVYGLPFNLHDKLCNFALKNSQEISILFSNVFNGFAVFLYELKAV